MITGYNFSYIELKHVKADSVAVKCAGTAVKVFDLVDGKVEIDTDNWEATEYNVQYFFEDEVIGQDVLLIKQNLKHADSAYNPKSMARQILQALQARLKNVATSTQLYVKVGDKEIRYLDYNELIKWYNFYQKQVAKEEGKPTQIRHQKLFYREPIGMWRR